MNSPSRMSSSPQLSSSSALVSMAWCISRSDSSASKCTADAHHGPQRPRCTPALLRSWPRNRVRNLRKKNRSQPQPTLYDLLGMSERELDTRLAVAMSAVSQQDVAFLTEYFDAIPLSEADQPHVAGRDFEVRPVDSFRRSQIVDRDV